MSPTSNVGQVELRIAEHFVRQVQPQHHLLLVGRGLRADPKHLSAQGAQLRVVIPIAAGLGRAAASSGNRVPQRWRGLLWPPGSGVAVQHSPARTERVELDQLPPVEGSAIGGSCWPERCAAAPSSTGAGKPAGRAKRSFSGMPQSFSRPSNEVRISCRHSIARARTKLFLPYRTQ